MESLKLLSFALDDLHFFYSIKFIEVPISRRLGGRKYFLGFKSYDERVKVKNIQKDGYRFDVYF